MVREAVSLVVADLQYQLIVLPKFVDKLGKKEETTKEHLTSVLGSTGVSMVTLLPCPPLIYKA